jgi:hypothetical protein
LQNFVDSSVRRALNQRCNSWLQASDAAFLGQDPRIPPHVCS